MLSHVKRERTGTDRTAVRGVAEWMSRSVETMRAELRLVECGSLDVLLYCQDDVAASARDPEVVAAADEL